MTDKTKRNVFYILGCVLAVSVIILGVGIYQQKDKEARKEKYNSILVDSMTVEGNGRKDDVLGCWFSVKIYETVTENKKVSVNKFKDKDPAYTLTLFNRKDRDSKFTVLVYDNGLVIDGAGYEATGLPEYVESAVSLY